VTLNLWPFFVKQHRLTGSYGRNRADIQATLEWAAAGKLKPVIDSIYPLDRAARLRAFCGRVISWARFWVEPFERPRIRLIPRPKLWRVILVRDDPIESLGKVRRVKIRENHPIVELVNRRGPDRVPLGQILGGLDSYQHAGTTGKLMFTGSPQRLPASVSRGPESSKPARLKADRACNANHTPQQRNNRFVRG